MERTRQASSAQEPILGIQSENSVPLWPCGAKVRGLARTAASGLVKARRRSLVIEAGRGLPCHCWSAGLGSKRSIWLGPPSMKRKITFLALAGKCGGGGGGGLGLAVALYPSRAGGWGSA